MKKNRRGFAVGFTLVELLVVIVVIAALAVLVATVSMRARKAAIQTAAMNAMRQIQMANIGYALENNGSYVPPEEDILDGDGGVTGTTKWFENPNFIIHLKGGESTFPGGGITPDLSLPSSLMDLAVPGAKNGSTTMGDCFGYTAPVAAPAYRQAKLPNPADSAAFITCDEPFVDHATKILIAYRHRDKALVVYYDGRTSALTKQDIDRIETNGGATNAFWNTDGSAVAP